MKAFSIDELLRQQGVSGDEWSEFLRIPEMSLGLYVLRAGTADMQSPHAEDEIYVVLEGRGVLRVDDDDRPVAKGDILFVERSADHRFHSITEDLKLLVVFAPAYSGRD